MNADQVREMRFRYRLDNAPKVVKTQRVIDCMNYMLSHDYTEADCREVVSTSTSSWQRAKAAYRKARDLEPGDPLVAGSMGGSYWHPLQQWQELARQRALEENTRERRYERNILTGRGWVSTIAKRAMRDEMADVHGADVGDPVADWHYLRFQQRRRTA